MTDKEIEKALALCIEKRANCCECGYFNHTSDRIACIDALLTDVIAYINRLKAVEEQICRKTVKEIIVKLQCDCSAAEYFGNNAVADYLQVTIYKLARVYGLEVNE